jgi:hypothetical protein
VSREEPLRCLIEEQQSDVLREWRFPRPADDIHLATELFPRHVADIGSEFASHIRQKVFNQPQREIVEFRSLVVAIIERHRRCQGHGFAHTKHLQEASK